MKLIEKFEGIILKDIEKQKNEFLYFDIYTIVL